MPQVDEPAAGAVRSHPDDHRRRLTTASRAVESEEICNVLLMCRSQATIIANARRMLHVKRFVNVRWNLPLVGLNAHQHYNGTPFFPSEH